jgi:hypothetical protein
MDAMDLPYGKRRPQSPVHAGVDLGSWQHDVLDVTMSMSTLLHSNGRDTVLGSFENPIAVDDGDTDVTMSG